MYDRKHLENSTIGQENSWIFLFFQDSVNPVSEWWRLMRFAAEQQTSNSSSIDAVMFRPYACLFLTFYNVNLAKKQKGLAESFVMVT